MLIILPVQPAISTSKFLMDYVYAAFSTARSAPVLPAPNVLTDIPSAPIDFLVISSASITAPPALILTPAPGAQLATLIAQERISA